MFSNLKNKFYLFYKDLSNSGSSLFQQQTQIASVASAIGYDPSRMGTFLGHHVPYNKPAQKLETIHENVPTSTQNVRGLLFNLNDVLVDLVLISNAVQFSLGNSFSFHHLMFITFFRIKTKNNNYQRRKLSQFVVLLVHGVSSLV